MTTAHAVTPHGSLCGCISPYLPISPPWLTLWLHLPQTIAQTVPANAPVDCSECIVTALNVTALNVAALNEARALCVWWWCRSRRLPRAVG